MHTDHIAGIFSVYVSYKVQIHSIPNKFVIFLFIMLPFFFIMMGFIYFDIREKNTAIGLRKEFELFGKRKRNQETLVDFD